MNGIDRFKRTLGGILIILLCVHCSVTGQKRELRPEDYKQWRYIDNPRISESGEWITCRIAYWGRSFIDQDDRKPIVQVYNTKTRQSFDLWNVYNASVFAGEKWIYYKVLSNVRDTVSKDSNIFMNLQSGEKILWNKPYPWHIDVKRGRVIWEVPGENASQLCVWDISTNDTIKLDDVITYNFL